MHRARHASTNFPVDCTCDGIFDTENVEDSESSESEPGDDDSKIDESEEIDRLEELPFDDEDGVYYGSDENS